jgi:hypothetical protein
MSTLNDCKYNTEFKVNFVLKIEYWDIHTICIALHKLYDTKEYNVEFWNSREADFMDKHNQICGIKKKEIINCLSMCNCIQLTKNESWLYLFNAIHEKDINKRIENLQKSAHLNNPFAQLLYADYLTKDKLEEAKRYFQKSAAQGYYSAVIYYILAVTETPLNMLSEYVCSLKTIIERKKIIFDLLQFLPILENNKNNQAILVASEICKVGYKNGILDSTYILKSYILADLDDLNESERNNYSDYREDILDGYRKMEKEIKTLKRNVAELLILKFNTIEDICKSIISEYL